MRQPSYAEALKKKPNALPVLFRRTRSGAGEGHIDAIFPTLPAKPGCVLTYARIGQHSEGTQLWLCNRTRPAKPEDYAELLAEVKRIYHDCEVVVCRVITPHMRAMRAANEVQS